MCIILLRLLRLVTVLMLSNMFHLVSCTNNNTSLIVNNNIESQNEPQNEKVTYAVDNGDHNDPENTSGSIISDEVNIQTTKPSSITTQINKMLTCPTIPKIDNAELELDDPNKPFGLGTTLNYSCKRGYRQTRGSTSIKCIETSVVISSSLHKSANWTAPTLVCELINCGDPGHVQNGFRLSNNLGFAFGSSISFTCETGYKIVGTPWILCNHNGHWNRDLPKCEPITCTKFEYKGIGTVKYSDDKRLFNSKATLSCPDGYHVEKNQTITCTKDAVWEGSLSKCVREYCLRNISYGVRILGNPGFQKFKPNQRVLAICHDGTKKTIRCGYGGIWDLNEFQCSEPAPKFCPLITPLDNGRHNGSTAVNGHPDGVVIAFYCNNNYYRDGPPRTRCLHGNWTAPKPRCALHEYGSLSRSPSSSNQLTVLGTVLFVILFFILIVLSIILHRLRQRHLEKQYWKKYFGNHTYRQSRTNITATCNQEMRFFCQSVSSVPVTDL